MRKLEFVGAVPADHAAPMDPGRVGEVDGEFFEDGEGIVGQKFAAQLVARKEVAIDQRDRRAAPRQQSCQRRSCRTCTDDCDIYFHSKRPNRYGHVCTTSKFLAGTLAAIARTSSGVYPRSTDAGASLRVIRPTKRRKPITFVTRNGM